MRVPLTRAATAATALAFLAGCITVGPDYVPPEAETPDAWTQAAVAGLSTGQADVQTWWTVFNDPVLDDLIARAGEGNLTLQTALARIAEARARRGVAAGSYYPTIDGIGAAQRTRISEEISPLVAERTDNFFQLGLDSFWELDVWGRVRRSVESADAALQASVEDYRDLLVSLYGEVALAYIDLRTLQARIRFAQENAEAQRGMLDLTRNRFNAGLVPELDVRQAELNVAITESTIPALRQGMLQTINRLGVLLGETPDALHEQLLQPGPVPAVPADVLVGLPAELLRQRPDIRRTERIVAAQTALIGVAKADLYPQFSLGGTFTLEARDAEDVLDYASRAYGFGPGFRWRLFDGNRIRSNIAAQEAVTQQALLAYEQTVLVALEEVESAMVGYAQERDRTRFLAGSVDAASKSVALVETLYRTGLTDFQNVLNMQRSLAQEQDRKVESEGLVASNLIRVYKALGGGWEIPEETAD